jgi:hypothetical protein
MGSFLHAAAAVASLLAGLLPDVGQCQITPEQAQQLRSAIATRIEALTILGGDFGLSDGTFRSTGYGTFEAGERTDTQLDVTKFGGAGDVGNPQPIGPLTVGWQPRLQGNMGYLESKNRIHSRLLEGDTSMFKNFAIQFGGGARFWLSGALSLAPTLMGMYGHTSNSYTANSAFMRANLASATRLGLVGSNVDTWTLRPALDVQYMITLDRTIVTLSSDPTYFHTESFKSSDANFGVNGDSGSLANKIDVDAPLGTHVYGHELHTGGYLSRTDLFGDLSSGLQVQHIDEIHGRLVLDFLNQLWKFQWIGVGASYLWGTHITGWTVGADVAYRF